MNLTEEQSEDSKINSKSNQKSVPWLLRKRDLSPPCQSPYNQEKERKVLDAIVNSLMVHVIDAVFQFAEHVQLAEDDEERNAKSNLGLV